MFSENIIARRIATYERNTGRKLRQVPVERTVSITQYLQGRTNSKGESVRPFVTAELEAFIENDRAMCKCSFRYWAERYAYIDYRIGMGGIDLFRPLESQLILLEKLAIAEEEMWARKDAGDTKYLGLCFMIHKARQLGFTTLCQLLLLYVTLFFSDRKTLSASVDDQKTQDMHAKWALAYERLPYWLQIPFSSQEKDRGKRLANGSYCALQDFAQKGGLGQGMTWAGGHLTEVAAVADAYCREQIQNHFLPSIADSFYVMAFMESTAQGAGNWWHQMWEQVDGGRGGRWKPAFIPAYAEPLRWSRPYAPSSWMPKEETQRYAESIERTSPKYMNGRTVIPKREHLLWWEEERQAAIDTGTLNLFQANYCVTPEESFQYAQGGAFNPQIITSMNTRINRTPVAYELVSNAQQRAEVRNRMSTEKGVKVLSAGAYGDLVPINAQARDEKDPRGLILLFEPPRLDVSYSIGVDPAVGLVGWDRRFRADTQDEMNKDNSCASGWYRDPRSQLINQAFEFAGPIAPRELARILVALGRVYSGANGPERGAPLIIEMNNGGTEVQTCVTTDHKYYNVWQRTKFDGAMRETVERWGWLSTPTSVQELWIYGKDMVEQPTLPIRPQSIFLIKEMSLARWDPVRRRGEVPAGNGQHDDRITAMLLALWQLRDHVPYGAYGEAVRAAATQQKRSSVDFQAMDIAGTAEYEEITDAWYNRVLYGK